jgi:hypothetical protein
MKRIILFWNLLLIPFFCFGQQNLPEIVFGDIPAVNSGKTYQIQVGAFRFEKNVEDAILQLKKNNLDAVTEKFHDLTRVMVIEIPANQVRSYLASIAKAGFKKVIIREDIPLVSLAPPKKQANNFGTSELLCNAWKIENCPNPELVGSKLFILKDGTYYIKNTKGELSSISNWRWNGDNGNRFEYSHNDWEYYGRADIIKLTDDSFELFDTGYTYETPGHSSAGSSNRWVFSPAPADSVP